MKKLALIVSILTLTNVLFAQEGGEDLRERRPIKIEKHKERLNLTEDQLSDLKELRESLQPEIKALREDESKSRSEKMKAHADIIEKGEVELAQILDQEQLTELEAIKMEMKEKERERRHGKRKHRGDGR